MEIELKYNIPDKETADAIWENGLFADFEEPGTREELFMDALYFDTEDMDLSKQEIAYRVRKESGNWIAALKWRGSAEGALHTREELCVPVSDDVPDVSVFGENETGRSLAGIIGAKPLVCMIRSSVVRKRFRIDTGSGIFEFSIDKGRIVTPAGEESILEAEVELFSGDTEELISIGEAMKERYALEESDESKYARGLRLLGYENAR